MSQNTIIEAKKGTFRLFSTTPDDVMERIREMARKHDKDVEYTRALRQREREERKARKAA